MGEPECIPRVQERGASVPAKRLRPRRLLVLAGDESLVQQIRRGNDAAFEVAFERHGPGIVAFCRHMLGSAEEAEDVVQHTFAAAFRDLRRGGERHIALKPWLYTIARNRCVSVLRSRRDGPAAAVEPAATAALAEEVERRAELRELLDDLRELPDDQRAALLLTEVGDLPHAEVAAVLGCEVHRVKALVFRARSGLIQRREARETPCEQIREQLANLRGGALRRTELRHHLRRCDGCRAYREQVRAQRRMLAAALPVAPSLGLKSSVLASMGIGGGGLGGAAGAGLGAGGAATTASLGAGGLAKAAAVAVLAGGGGLAGTVALHESGGGSRPAAVRSPAPPGERSPAATVAPSTPAAKPARGRAGTPPRARTDGDSASGKVRDGHRGKERGAAARADKKQPLSGRDRPTLAPPKRGRGRAKGAPRRVRAQATPPVKSIPPEARPPVERQPKPKAHPPQRGGVGSPPGKSHPKGPKK
jgi:RNA polymerase sigma factor (sigma-70 family)